MKKIVALILLVSVFGCDKITHPLQNYVPPAIPQRKVLLEDYTGHHCGFCPPAAEVATQLEEKYGDNIVTIAVHAGYFSTTNSEYPTSYTTTVGNEWNYSFLGLAAAYPSGMINRKNYADNGLVTTHTKWPTTSELGFNDAYVLDLDIMPEYQTSTRMLNVEVKAKFRQAYSGDVMVSVVLTEDSIIGAQKDYRIKGAEKIKDYVFNHMLRASLNGTWGTTLKSSSAKANDSLTVSFTNFEVSADFKEKHLSVVAFAFDKATREVLEVEKVKILKDASL